MVVRFGPRTLLLAALALSLTCVLPLRALPWTPFGPDGGDARRLATDPTDHTHLFLGTANGWIYQSHTSGKHWDRVARVGKRDDLVLDSIVVDPQNPKHLIVGAWVVGKDTDGGIYLSQDGGLTWTNQAEMRGQSVRSLAVSRSDPRTLVAGSLRGVFRSTDGGLRWSRISPEDSTEIHDVQSIAIDPRDPAVIYAGTWHLPWKSEDGGEHWNPMKDGIIDDSDVFSIIVDPTSPATVFASACSGIYKSDNSGVHFEKVQGIPSSARRTRVLLQDPHHLDTVFAGTTQGLFRSDDAGVTWQRTTGPEIIVNDVSVDLADPRHVLIATDRGGVLSSEDGGETFHSSNSGFSARQITSLKRDANRPSTLFVGVVNDKDWGGVFQSDNGGLDWTQRSDGLEGRDVFSLGQAPDGTVIAGTSHGLFRLDSTGQAWQRVVDAPGAPSRPISVQAILIRPPVPVGHHPVAKRSTRPQTPAQRKAALVSAHHKPASRAKPLPARLAKSAKSTPATRKAQALAASRQAAALKKAQAVVAAVPADPLAPVAPSYFDGSVYSIVTAGDVVLASTSVGLLSSSDNGQSWSASGPKGSSEWRFLAASKKHVAAATLHAVFVSSDSGALWESVTIPESLSFVSAVAVEPNGELWVGGREGVFVSSDQGKSWSTPPNLFVNSINNIFYDEPSNRVVITMGGGSSIVFTVLLPKKAVTFTDTGWNLRFARSLGDHLVAATLYDGIVVQPRMVASPLAAPPAPPSPPAHPNSANVKP